MVFSASGGHTQKDTLPLIFVLGTEGTLTGGARGNVFVVDALF